MGEIGLPGIPGDVGRRGPPGDPVSLNYEALF